MSDYALAFLANDVRWLLGHVANLGDDRLTDVFLELEQVRFVFSLR